MKKVLHILTLLLAFATISNAQAPWKAKFVVHYKDPDSPPDSAIIIARDTVWFGFDPMGDDGYQEGLDIIDTISENRVYGYDSAFVMQSGNTCKRFRQDIKVFKNLIRFHFESFGHIYYISWEKDDFKYHDTLSGMVLLFAAITSIDAPINDWGAHHAQFYNYPNQYWTTTAEVMIENKWLPYHPCAQYYDLFRFYVILAFNFPTGIKSLADERSAINIKVNTNNQSVLVTGLDENAQADYSLYSTTGKLIKQGEITNSIIHYNDLPNGMYLLSVNNDLQHITKKLIIFNAN